MMIPHGGLSRQMAPLDGFRIYVSAAATSSSRPFYRTHALDDRVAVSL
ncbi:MAG: hypothetical protein JNK85_06970 [Verrucomicrobiales bacterium]|nr:hypothetical protein [Verrucomicrobiales bacterium]